MVESVITFRCGKQLPWAADDVVNHRHGAVGVCGGFSEVELLRVPACGASLGRGGVRALTPEAVKGLDLDLVILVILVDPEALVRTP
ncbi:hypothetical protein IWX64_002336 [Arthrobacter sp. CAN_A212]|uniref:hypothetical protein n=1 Tax=unclassified Arthrobacter TaxID=235627 RepID=UPI0018CA5273|nr:hypothetical protein [Arthrobacter sp. CAN_C5]MBP2217686.1 hypothetical protein [Arthrobacter sp. CAN_C5]